MRSPAPAHFESEADVLTWLESSPDPEQVLAVANRPPYQNAELIARHCRLSLFTPEQLAVLFRGDTTRTLALFNPTLTSAQAAYLLEQAVQKTLSGESGSNLGDYMLLLERAGHKVPRNRILERIRDAVFREAEAVDKDPEIRFRGKNSMASFHLTRYFWFDLDNQDLRAIARAKGWSESTSSDVARHPAASDELLLELFQRHSNDQPVLTALANNPRISRIPSIVQGILAKDIPWSSAALAPHLDDITLRGLVGRMAGLHPRRALTFLESLAEDQLRRLRPTDLLPVLQADDEDIRLKAQTLVGRTGVMPVEGEAPEQRPDDASARRRAKRRAP